MQKGGFSLPGPILPTRSMWQFWASETLQKRLSNASVTLQKRPTSGLHVLLDVFIHCGRFHGQWARRCGALLARVRVRLAAACATANPRFTHPRRQRDAVTRVTASSHCAIKVYFLVQSRILTLTGFFYSTHKQIKKTHTEFSSKLT